MPDNRAVFITGAAAGIGRATALTFARNGFTVGGYDIDEVGLKSLADEVEDVGGKAVTGHLDVTDPDEMAQRVSEFAKAAGDRLDVMINNAGILLAGRFEDIDVAAHLKEIDINTKGVVNGLHAAFPFLRSTPKSVVVNLASASAIYGQAELANYSATKFFVRGITEALDIEWNRYGIRVIAMWPLYVQTVMTDNISTGTTGAVAKRLGRRFVGIERDAGYAAAAQTRIASVAPLPAQSLASFQTAREAPRVPFAALIERGMVLPGARLCDAKRKVKALVRADGAITLGETVGSIHRIGALAQGLEACNGWAFWHLETTKGLVSIDALRAEIRAEMGPR